MFGRWVGFSTFKLPYFTNFREITLVGLTGHLLRGYYLN